MALSIALSVVIVPSIGVALSVTGWGIRLTPIVVAVSGFTVACTAIGAYRRLQLPDDRRFAPSVREWLTARRRWLFGGDGTVDKALGVLVVASVLVALGSVGYAGTVPQRGDSFTELYLLTENESGGLTAEGYPSEMGIDDPGSVYVTIENHEHETVEYAVVVQLQRVGVRGNETEVRERAELDRFTTTLEHGETYLEEHTLAPSGALTGEDLRLTFLLYEDDPPETPTRADAYRSVHLWVDVTE